MNKQTMIAAALSVSLATAYLASTTANTAMITSLPANGFPLGFLVLALIGGFVAYAFSSLIQNRLARRLIFVGSFALALFAGGNAWRAVAIQRLFAQPLTRHAEALPVSMVQAGSIGLQSPYTRTVFTLPTTIVPASQSAGFAYVGKCARVQIEETANGDKRIVKDAPPVSAADIGPCSSR